MGGQHSTAFKGGDKWDDNRQTKTVCRMIFTEAKSFTGRHHTTSVIWKQKGKVWLKTEKRERENLISTKEKASPQRNPTVNKCPFYLVPQAGWIAEHNYFWDPDLTCQTPPPLKETSRFHSNCSHIFWKFASLFQSQQAHLKITTLVLFGTACHVTLITLLEQN